MSGRPFAACYGSAHLHPCFQSTRSARFRVNTFVTVFAVWCALFALPHPVAADIRRTSTALLKTIENRYNHAQSLKLDFSETYAGSRRPVQTESGVLYLRKPGRMRWEYTSPAGKLFISDGKDVFLYTPDDQRAEKSKLKESEDMRAPLAFLLGKLDFAKEFKSFRDPRRRARTPGLQPSRNRRTWRIRRLNFWPLPMARSAACASPGRISRSSISRFPTNN